MKKGNRRVESEIPLQDDLCHADAAEVVPDAETLLLLSFDLNELVELSPGELRLLKAVVLEEVPAATPDEIAWSQKRYGALMRDKITRSGRYAPLSDGEPAILDTHVTARSQRATDQALTHHQRGGRQSRHNTDDPVAAFCEDPFSFHSLPENHALRHGTEYRSAQDLAESGSSRRGR